MTRVLLLAHLLVGVALQSAAAEPASESFPVGRQFRAVALNKVELTAHAPTLAVVAAQGGGHRAHGSTGCNLWTGPVVLGADGMLTLGSIISTRKACVKEAMQIETTFLDGLHVPVRWSLDAGRLRLANERIDLTLAPIEQP